MNRLVQNMDNLAFCLLDKITITKRIVAAAAAATGIGFAVGYMLCLFYI